jgi:phosphotriesterase-related protein
VQYLSDKDNAAAIVGLFEAGYGCQIPLSQDVFIKMMLLACGCNCYVHLQCHFPLHLLRHGLTKTDLSMLMIDNPRQALVRKVTKGNHK